jgi:4-hydroxybenzoate polyprenyltransferase
MINFFKLIRFPNLIIIALTQYMFRYFILLPLIHKDHVAPAMSNFNFGLLVLSTMMVAAAGYAINDYFDVRADKINKPKKMLIGRGISRRQAMLCHTVLSIIAVLIGVYLSYRVGSFKLGLINLVTTIFLWFYSTKYKAYFLVGNILVAVFSGFVVVVVWLFEMAALNHQGIMLVPGCYKDIYGFMLSYFIFAALVSLIREIIKDIEDIEGDKKIGCSTMPVVIGVRKSQYVISGLSFITLAGLSYICYIFKLNHLTMLFWYIALALCLPVIYMIYISIIAKSKSDFTLLSGMAKYTLVAGVFSMLVIYLI